jgi:hypothetical protein
LKNGAPQSSVPGVLIDQHADSATFSDEFARRGESLFPFKQRQSEPRARPPHFFVDKPIPQRLVNRANLALEKDRRKMREQLPIPDVADREGEAAFRGKLLVHLLEPLHTYTCLDLLAAQSSET